MFRSPLLRSASHSLSAALSAAGPTAWSFVASCGRGLLRQTRFQATGFCLAVLGLTMYDVTGCQLTAFGQSTPTSTVTAMPDADPTVLPTMRVRIGELQYLGFYAWAVPDPGNLLWSWEDPSGVQCQVVMFDPHYSYVYYSATFNSAGRQTVATAATATPDPANPSNAHVGPGGGGGSDPASIAVTVVEVTGLALKAGVKPKVNTMLYRSDFDITTNPPGNEDLVDVPTCTPTHGSNTVTATCGTSTAPATFTATGTGACDFIDLIEDDYGSASIRYWYQVNGTNSATCERSSPAFSPSSSTVSAPETMYQESTIGVIDWESGGGSWAAARWQPSHVAETASQSLQLAWNEVSQTQESIMAFGLGDLETEAQAVIRLIDLGQDISSKVEKLATVKCKVAPDTSNGPLVISVKHLGMAQTAKSDVTAQGRGWRFRFKLQNSPTLRAVWYSLRAKAAKVAVLADAGGNNWDVCKDVYVAYTDCNGALVIDSNVSINNGDVVVEKTLGMLRIPNQQLAGAAQIWLARAGETDVNGDRRPFDWSW